MNAGFLRVLRVFFCSLTDQLPDANTASHVHSFACTLRGTLNQNHPKAQHFEELSAKTQRSAAQCVEHSIKRKTKLYAVRNFKLQTGI